MFFGMTNSPPTFQRMINEIFWDMISTGETFFYMDDGLMATFGDLEHHREVVKEVLKRLKENDLFLRCNGYNRCG